jgi:hypothetical protein
LKGKRRGPPGHGQQVIAGGVEVLGRGRNFSAMVSSATG